MKAGSDKILAKNCSKSAVDSDRNRIVTNISPNTVNTDEGVYVRVYLPGDCTYALNGVTIVYTSNL